MDKLLESSLKRELDLLLELGRVRAERDLKQELIVLMVRDVVALRSEVAMYRAVFVQVPGGYKVVPVTPTEEMIEAGDDICPVARGTETHRMSGGRVPEDYWRVMIAAAPTVGRIAP